MIFTDITTDKKTRYILKTHEKRIFFFLNRSGEITFNLTAPGAEAHIYALYTGQNNDSHQLTIKQHHIAPDTKSSALVKSVLDDDSSFSYHGTIRIEEKAARSEATQENRNLLLSKTAAAITLPVLEILNPEVVCRHAATVSAPKEDQIFTLGSRGIAREAAIHLLAEGFKQEVLDHNPHHQTI